MKPNLIWWEKGSQPPQMLASGEVVMIDAYNGRIAAANDEGQEELQDRLDEQPLHDRLVGHHEGHRRTRPHAEKFLVFVNDPQNQKNLPPKIPYGVTAKAATALIDKSVLPNLATAPENFKAVAVHQRQVLAREPRQAEPALQRLGREVGLNRTLQPASDLVAGSARGLH